MPELNIVLREPAWPDLKDRRDEVIHVTGPIGITALPGGMSSGATSVMLRIDLPDGRVVLAESSLALFVAAVRALQGRFPSPEGTGESAP